MSAIGAISTSSASAYQSSAASAAGGQMPQVSAAGAGQAAASGGTMQMQSGSTSMSIQSFRSESSMMTSATGTLGAGEPSKAVQDLVQLMAVLLILEAMLGKDDEKKSAAQALVGMMLMAGAGGSSSVAMSSSASTSMAMTSQSMDVVTGAYGLAAQPMAPGAGGSLNVMA